MRSVVVLVLLASTAYADDRAKQLFDEGRAALKDENWDLACEKFSASLELDNATGTKVNLAECTSHQDKLVKAYRLFEEAASEDDASGNAKRAAFSRERMAALAKQLAHVIVEAPRNATVEINGKETDQLDRMLLPGEIVVVAHAKGFPDFTKKKQVGAGEELRIVVPAFVAKPSEEAGPRDPTRKKIALALGIGGVLTLLVGGYTGLSGQEEYDETLRNRECEPSGAQLKCTVEGAAHIDHAKLLTNVANGLAVGGGVLVVAGFVVFVTAPRVPVAPVVAGDQVGIAFVGRF